MAFFLAACQLSGRSLSICFAEMRRGDVGKLCKLLLTRGGGLIRSMGGLGKFLLRDSEHREAADKRILGGGDFVEPVLGNCEPVKASESVMVSEILAEVAGRTGVPADEVLGSSRGHIISKARCEFYLYVHEKTGASLTALGKLTGHTHVAVLLPIEEAGKEREGL